MSKAGSSAIQKVLLDNEEVLHRHGFVYPSAGRNAGAHYMINEQLRSGRFPELLLEALREAGEMIPLLSCEGFWLLDDAGIELLCSALTGYNTNVILYLRNPCGYMPSSFRQSIKAIGRAHNEEKYLEMVARNMDYSNLLLRWEKYFKISVAVYDEHKADLIQHFLSLLGIAPNDVKLPVELVNPTPPDGTIEAMRLANIIIKGRAGRVVRSWIYHHPGLFASLKLRDQRIKSHAKEVPRTWDMEVIRRHVPPDSLRFLLANTVLSESATE